jgi:hypothetical protein
MNKISKTFTLRPNGVNDRMSNATTIFFQIFRNSELHKMDLDTWVSLERLGQKNRPLNQIGFKIELEN